MPTFTNTRNRSIQSSSDAQKKKSTGKKGNGGVLREYTQLITLVQIEFVQEEYP